MALYDKRKVAGKERLKAGFYVTDEKRLFRILDAAEGHVLLEDARYPDDQPIWMNQKDVVNENMRLVRPRK